MYIVKNNTSEKMDKIKRVTIMQAFKFERKRSSVSPFPINIIIYDTYIDRMKDNGYLTSAKQLKPKALLG